VLQRSLLGDGDAHRVLAMSICTGDPIPEVVRGVAEVGQVEPYGCTVSTTVPMRPTT
jgi:hypothetical protein